MEEIKIFFDKFKKNEIKEEIEFERIIAGKISIQSIYIFNTTKYNLKVELKLEGENISISKTIESLDSNQIQEVEFKFTPKLTLMKPITASLKIKISYIIR